MQKDIIFTHIANALARDYTDLFYVNMDTNEYIEYYYNGESESLVERRRASDFFESCERESKLFVHPEDQETFVNAMNREFLKETLDRDGRFTMVYRRIKDERVFYVQMKVSRMADNDSMIVIAVSDIDELVMKRREEEKIQEERIIYARLHAITGNFLVVYVVDPETDRYREFSSTAEYAETFPMEKEGEDFFAKAREVAHQYIFPPDVSRYLSTVNKETIMAEIEQNGIFSLGYRFMLNRKPVYVQLKAAIVEEKEGPRLVVGLNDIDLQVRREQSIERRLVQAESQANRDALTGVRNKHAYIELAAEIDLRIREKTVQPFAVVMLDMNDLKKINDTSGHQAGDQCLRDVCKSICDTFKHSPVFRIGGDEFAVIVQGEDYKCLDQRIEEMKAHNLEALQKGGIVIACGVAIYEQDDGLAEVFDRADQKMYENKIWLKKIEAESIRMS